MKKHIGLLGASIAVSTLFIGTNAQALGIQTEPNGKTFRYHYVNKWPYGCVPVKLSSGAKNYWKAPDDPDQSNNIIGQAFNEWNSKVPNIFIFNREQPPANTPAECLDQDVYLDVGIDSLSCRVINNASHGALAENQSGSYRTMRLNSSLIKVPGTDIELKGCIHSSLSDLSRKRAVTHELGHALGFVHEHQRADAATYLDLVEENLFSGITAEYKPESKNAHYLSGYDYFSIMHYGTRQGAKNQNEVDSYQERLKTLIPIEDLPGGVIPPAEPATFAELEYFQLNNATISATDAAAANAFYAPGKADIGVELKKIRGCSQTRFDQDKCEAGEVPHQLNFKGTVVNHGAYDSGAVAVEYVLPSAVQSIIEIDDSNCAASGDRVMCNYANMTPGQANVSSFKVVLSGSDADEKKPYSLSVASVSALDNLDYNDVHETQMDTKGGSLGVLGAVLMGIAGFVRRRKTAKL